MGDIKLLRQALSTRLTYGVKVTWDGIHSLTITPYVYCAIVEETRPDHYPKLLLRPLPSITDDELKELRKECPHAVFDPEGVFLGGSVLGIDGSDYGRIARIEEASKILEFCCSHHLDYQGLIEKGLAVEVTPDNNPYE